MRTVWKFKCLTVNPFEIEMPIGARIISAGQQHDKFCLWALVDTECRPEVRKFRIYGTGAEIPWGIKLQYVGTGHFEKGLLVFHLFEEVPA